MNKIKNQKISNTMVIDQCQVPKLVVAAKVSLRGKKWALCT